VSFRRRPCRPIHKRLGFRATTTMMALLSVNAPTHTRSRKVKLCRFRRHTERVNTEQRSATKNKWKQDAGSAVLLYLGRADKMTYIYKPSCVVYKHKDELLVTDILNLSTNLILPLLTMAALLHFHHQLAGTSLKIHSCAHAAVDWAWHITKIAAAANYIRRPISYIELKNQFSCGYKLQVARWVKYDSIIG